MFDPMLITPFRKGHLLLISDLGGGNFGLMSAFPGFHKWQDRNLVLRITGANLDYLLANWPDADWQGGTSEERDRHLAARALAEESAREKETLVVTSDDFRYRREPMEHQRKAFHLSRDREAFGLFMEQGTGKTKVIIDTACHLYARGAIDFLVIVAWPNGVHQNWVDYELPLDMSVPYVAEAWSHNHSALHRRVALRKVTLQRDKLRVLSFNIEAFVSSHAQETLLEVLNNNKVLLVIDQSASIKNPTAKRTQFLINECAELAPFRRVLDGAPVAEGAEELYSQFKFLDERIIGHDTWTAFRAEFCIIGWFKQIEGYKNLEELRRRIDGYCYRVLASECQDLPERIYKRWPFDLGKEERRIYDELKKKELSFFNPDVDQGDTSAYEDHEHIEEHRALTKSLRLQQVASGWWPSAEDFRSILTTLPSRLEALLRLLRSEATGKAVIFSRFRSDLDVIARALGKDAAEYHGGIADAQRRENKDRFLNDPKCLYLLGTPGALGIGHTLTSARHVIFYTNYHSLRLREECEKRVHRTGQKHHVMVWDLIANETQDPEIVQCLREKKDLAREILQDPDGFFLRYDS